MARSRQTASRARAAVHAPPSWRSALPILRTPTASLREVRGGDARALADWFVAPEVREYLPVGPQTSEDFARFICWVRRERRAGRSLCFAVVPNGRTTASGIVQLWGVEPNYRTAEIGVALDRSLWGTSTWTDCTGAVLDFAFDVIGTRRIECRIATPNVRAQAALQKLGAVREGPEQ